MSQQTNPVAPQNNSVESNHSENPLDAWLRLTLEPHVRKVLPSQMSLTRFMTGVKLAMLGSGSLSMSNHASIASECVKAASFGLYIDGQEAALVPFKGQAKLMPMVKGLTKLARNSGEISSVITDVIYKNDKFKKWTDDTGEHLEHEPDIFSEDRGERIGAYALIILKDGSRLAEVMNKKQIGDVRAVSRSKTDSPWEGPFADQMWRKSPLRRVLGRAPSSSDLDLAFKSEDELYDLKAPAPEMAADKPKVEAGSSSRLQGLMAAKASPAPQEQEPPPPAYEFESDDIPL